MIKTTAIIFISTRIKQGQYPKVKDFTHNPEHGLYLYKGRELELEEFNAAAKDAFSRLESNWRFSVQLIEREATPEPPVVSPTAADPTGLDALLGAAANPISKPQRGGSRVPATP